VRSRSLSNEEGFVKEENQKKYSEESLTGQKMKQGRKRKSSNLGLLV